MLTVTYVDDAGTVKELLERFIGTISPLSLLTRISSPTYSGLSFVTFFDCVW